MKHLFLSIAVVFQFASLASANFGFQTIPEQMPLVMQSQIDRVFMVYSLKKNQPVGTAYLIYNDGKQSLFATAKHVIMPVIFENWRDNLSDLVLLRKASWQNGPNDHLKFDLKLKVEELSALVRDTKDWKFSVPAEDVGLIKAESHLNLPIVDLKTLGMSVRNKIGSLNKKQHFILGYPAHILKDEHGSKIASVQLSLSSGDISYEVPKGEKFVLESTADSRSGNSGSPVFSREGTLLGILSGGGRPHEYVQYPLMNSRIVPIDYLKIHLGNYLMKRKSNISSCRLSLAQ